MTAGINSWLAGVRVCICASRSVLGAALAPSIQGREKVERRKVAPATSTPFIRKTKIPEISNSLPLMSYWPDLCHFLS